MGVRTSRAWTALACSLLMAAPAAAQTGTITGRVTSADNGQPLSSADVRALNASGQAVASTLTTQNGAYRLSGLTPGSYVVAASAIGFSEQRTAAVQVTAGGNANADLVLPPAAVELNPVVVSVSKQAEKALEAPARVEVIDEERIEARPTVTPVDHLRGTPGVDVITQGLQSTNVVVRGFNNIFSGSLHTLTDNRIAGVPSLRVNVMHFVPASDEDLQRIEVVLGPGAALYGPNTAAGVLHLITKSPLLEQGSSLSVSGGERSVLGISGRTAHLFGENFGVKLSAQYLSGDEWPFTDPVEVDEQEKFASDPAFWTSDLARAAGISEPEAAERIARVGGRDFDVERFGGELRADWRITDELTGILTTGMTNVGSGIELTGLGAAQVENWRYSFVQARANWRRLFVQGYVNLSDAGDTYLLRNGTPIVDKSKLWVGQVQHGLSLGDKQNFTYGLDWLYTLPETEGTINGIYEEEDETTEFGGYLQSETALSPKFDLVLAGRVDTHSALPDAVFSPRAALVFKPAEDHAFRLTFNRAFSTPSSLNQFLDLGTPIPVEAAARLGYSVRVQGTGETGFHFRQSDGSFLVRSPFAPQPETLLPANAAAFWRAAVGVVNAQQPIPPQLLGYLNSLQPTGTQISTLYNLPGTTVTGPIDQLQLPDIEPIRESTTTGIETGYKGILAERLLLAADLWYERRENFVTPLTTFTPFIVMSPQDIVAFLVPQFMTDLGMSQEQATATATSLAGGLAQVPVGVIGAPEMHVTGAQLLASYTNVDDEFDLWGVDLSGEALLTDVWSLAATASFVNDDAIETDTGLTVTLNAPKTKGSVSLRYRDRDGGIFGEARVRYNDGFPAQSGVYEGTACLPNQPASALPCVDGATLFDVNVEYRIPTLGGASLALSVQNLFDEDYVSFPGVPPIGRLALLRLKYSF
jgi:outer membrane receptor for ferrienterochelin and colicins